MCKVCKAYGVEGSKATFEEYGLARWAITTASIDKRRARICWGHNGDLLYKLKFPITEEYTAEVLLWFNSRNNFSFPCQYIVPPPFKCHSRAENMIKSFFATLARRMTWRYKGRLQKQVKYLTRHVTELQTRMNELQADMFQPQSQMSPGGISSCGCG